MGNPEHHRESPNPNDYLERMMPRKRTTLLMGGGGFNPPGSNFSSANSNLGSNSSFVNNLNFNHPSSRLMLNPHNMLGLPSMHEDPALLRLTDHHLLLPR